jgi:hypothetical protein
MAWSAKMPAVREGFGKEGSDVVSTRRLPPLAGSSTRPDIGPYQDALSSASFELFGSVRSLETKGDLHARLSLELEDSVRPGHGGIQPWPGCIYQNGVG